MTVNLSALAGAGQQFFDDNGSPLTGGKLYSYAAGTTTPQATYTSASGSTAHSNPIVLNAAGRVATGEIWVTAGINYKFVLKTSTDTTIATWDNITGINGTGITSNASSVEYDPAGVNAVPTTVQAKLRESVSVLDFGAVGNGTTDDTTAIQAAIDSVSIAGGVLYFPIGVYRVTARLLIGKRFVDEAQVVDTIDNYTEAASFNSALAATTYTLPYVSIDAVPGTVIWGDFTPVTETALLYYGILNSSVKNTQEPYIQGLTFIAKAGMTAGVKNNIPGDDPVPSGQMGLFIAGALINVDNITFYDLSRSLVTSACYWSTFGNMNSIRSNTAYTFVGNNATASNSILASYAHVLAFSASGQGLTFRGLYTEQCVVDFYTPGADNLSIDTTYFENTNAANTDFSCKFGDGTRTAYFVTLLNSHISRSGNKGLFLTKAQIEVIGSHIYTTSGILADSVSSAYLLNTTCAVDASNTGNIVVTNTNILQSGGGLYVANATVNTTDSSTSGFRFGTTRMWFDPTYGILKYKVGTPSGTTDGYSLVPVIVQYSEAWGTIANGTYAADTLSAAFFTMGNQYSVSPLSALPTGVFMNAQCNANGSLTVYVWNFSGSSQAIGTVAYVMAMSITV
jgi:hypothetical protein